MLYRTGTQDQCGCDPKVNRLDLVSVDQEHATQERSLKLKMVGQQLSTWGCVDHVTKIGYQHEGQ
jgi:hypothetical protein